MAIAPCFFAITDPNLGPVSLQITPMTSNMILEYPRGKENGYWVILITN